MAIAAAACLIAAKGNAQAGWAALHRRVLSPAVWWSASARADYKLFAINQAVMRGLAPRLLSQLALATLLFEYFHLLFGVPPRLGGQLPGWVPIAAFTASQFILDDLSRYLVHRLLHRIPLLWAFHKVHHSAATLTPMTVFRTHPVEAVLFALRSAAVQGGVIAGCVFIFGSGVDLATVLGANVFLFVFNASGANLRHSHVWISYGRAAECVVMSPAQHQIHHSTAPEHFDRNFGSALAVWDLLGGTLYRPGRETALSFGLSRRPSLADHGLWQLYAEPFVEAARLASRAPRYTIRPSSFPARKRRRSASVLVVNASTAEASEVLSTPAIHRRRPSSRTLALEGIEGGGTARSTCAKNPASKSSTSRNPRNALRSSSTSGAECAWALAKTRRASSAVVETSSVVTSRPARPDLCSGSERRASRYSPSVTDSRSARAGANRSSPPATPRGAREKATGSDASSAGSQ